MSDDERSRRLRALFDVRDEETILRRERIRLAGLLTDNAEEIGAYANDPVAAVRFVADLISVNTGDPGGPRRT